ncbi:VOC family protein [Paraburkholderia pallida]|uniref:VOC family protein n=1 Tax=Paraburkholderia pallida TaxID=2547399 RepID=A0A4P7D570_9BURK|nr:VOC family protein [Paraburkholderia pallida]QBR03208.1 VOC family protein [Paraburkholderia pallida]
MNRPSIAGIHHLKFNVSDLDRSLAFYSVALGAKRIPELDHRLPDGELFAYILEIDRLGTYLELRASPAKAAREAGLDPVTFSVETHDDLVAWHDYLEANGIPHSPVFTGVTGWLLAAEDPDGRHLRFYTLETHPVTTAFSSDEYWLGV